MKFDVHEGLATIRLEGPVFVGTTGDKGKDGEFFPHLGTHMNGFRFAPKEGDAGIIVFDRKIVKERRALSPSYIHYWWKKGQLQVREDLPRKVANKVYHFDPDWGLIAHGEDGWGNTYYTYRTLHVEEHLKQVPLIEFLKFLEGKLSSAELDKTIITG